MNGCADGLTGALSYLTNKAKSLKVKQLIIAAALVFAAATITMYVHGFCKVIQLFFIYKGQGYEADPLNTRLWFFPSK